jgi:hypothetical protein
MSIIPSLTRFNQACPFLRSTPPTVLRSLAGTTTATSGITMSGLTARAYTACPVMGPALGAKLGRGYASVAGKKEVDEIHKVSERSEQYSANGASIASEQILSLPRT